MEERPLEDKYIISDVSKLIDVEPHVLRYWEEELSLQITRNQLGHRYYNQSDLELLKKIKDLKEQGLQLRAIKVMLSSINTDACQEMKPKLNTNLAIQENRLIDTSSNSKLRQFQEYMKEVIQTSLKENNEILREELTSQVSEHMRNMLTRQEEIEEKRFRKLDETIREIQRGRQEIAVAKTRGGFLSKRKDKSFK